MIQRILNKESPTVPSPVAEEGDQAPIEAELDEEALPAGKKTKAELRFSKQMVKEARDRLNRRPRIIVLVPNRELAHQVFATAKQVCGSQLECALLIGGPMRDTQAKVLKRSSPDLIVATPQRLLHHRKEGLSSSLQF